jgi:3'-phosphoadenosine 5'-phosphosulfate sulfotransferase (PAPS reductase)/FAD synthetase
MKLWLIEAARLHAKLPAHRRRVEKSRQVLQTFLSASYRPYVAVSGGKDSTCCLSLARDIRPDILAVCSHDQWLLPETEEYLRRVDRLEVIAGPHTHDGGLRTWRHGRPADLPKWITWVECENYPLETYVKQRGWMDCIIGLRKDEAARRRIMLSKHGHIVKRKDGIINCYPLADWQDMDVWAFLLGNDVDYNRAYDRLCEMDFPMREWRTGPWWNGRAMQAGSLVPIGSIWPETLDKFKRESGWIIG